MKRALNIMLAAVLAACVFSCQKPVNPDLPTIEWPSNTSFAQLELAPGVDGAITISAPGKLDILTITMGLGDYAILANPYIGVSSNKGSGKNSPVLDVIDDPTVASFLQNLGMSAGPGLRGKTVANLNLVDILEKLFQGQPVQNNTSFTMKIDLKDQAGNSKTATARFHFTSAPSFTWDGNAAFNTVDLNAAKMPCKLRITAPGKIEALTVTLENGADNRVVSNVKNRTANGGTVMDLVNDEEVAKYLSQFFPTGTAVTGKTELLMDFGFMYDWAPDMGTSTNVFTIKAVDRNGKDTTAQVKFKK